MNPKFKFGDIVIHQNIGSDVLFKVGSPQLGLGIKMRYGITVTYSGLPYYNIGDFFTEYENNLALKEGVRRGHHLTEIFK
jgi:hypothetical protein